MKTTKKNRLSTMTHKVQMLEYESLCAGITISKYPEWTVLTELVKAYKESKCRYSKMLENKYNNTVRYLENMIVCGRGF